ncbi:MAG: flagellar hook assembly protein FlgD [Gemmatimonadota bacterium]
MIAAPILGPAQPNVTPPATVSKGKGSLGKDEFLQLLVTQLRHQDPLNPADASQFSAQLAQFSSLEQLSNLNTLLTAQQATNQFASQTSLGSSLIGKNVLVTGNEVESRQIGPVSVIANVGGTGGKGTLEIMDHSGSVVASIDEGQLSGGLNNLTTGSTNLAPGLYTYKLSVTDGAGAAVDVTQYEAGTVDGVTVQNGVVTLRSGALTFELNNLVEIESGPAGAPSGALAGLSLPRITHSSKENSKP